VKYVLSIFVLISGFSLWERRDVYR